MSIIHRAAFINFSFNIIKINTEILIPLNQQMIVHGQMLNEGRIIIDGQLVII